MGDARLPLRIGGVLRCCIATLDAIGPPRSMTKEGDTLSCSYCSSGLIVRDGAWEWWHSRPGDYFGPPPESELSATDVSSSPPTGDEDHIGAL